MTFATTNRVNTKISSPAVSPTTSHSNTKQVILYTICGGISALIMTVIISGLNVLYPDYVDQERLSQELVSQHTNVFNTIAFIPSSLVAFFTNRILVFGAGKHPIALEFLIYSMISTVSYLGGIKGSAWIVESLNTPSYIGSIIFGVSTAIINFFCRKFIIFRK